MDEFAHESSPKAFTDVAKRRDALGAISAAAMALLATLGLPDGGDAKKEERQQEKEVQGQH